ncbi:MAG: hypothetical protein M3N57_13265 [Actinomycetota bacterium]|nr:hypothetical protein [Actinomycetota bacterium]
MDGHDLSVTVPLDRGAWYALGHLGALHGHERGCHYRAEVHVDLLRRSLRAGGAWPLCVLIRPDPDPACWLRIATAQGSVELDLELLDAAMLLLSGRFTTAVVPAVRDPWADTLQRLLHGRTPGDRSGSGRS